jgi:ATP-dependent RNA helicase DeaD
MLRYRIEVGHDHEVKPGNIVGAIANEAGLDSKYIGHIKIHDDHSFVDLPDGMPKEVFKELKKVWVSGQQLNITRSGDTPSDDKPRKRRAPGQLSKPGKSSRSGKTRDAGKSASSEKSGKRRAGSQKPARSKSAPKRKRRS